MADHTITLNAKQEAAAQALVDEINARNPGDPTPMTIERLIERYAMPPIRAKIEEERINAAQSVTTAYEAATKTVQDQVKTLLGI